LRGDALPHRRCHHANDTAQRLFQVCSKLIQWFVFKKRFHRIYHRGTGDLTPGVTAHAIGNREKRKAITKAYRKARILVGSTTPGCGAGGKLETVHVSANTSALDAVLEFQFTHRDNGIKGDFHLFSRFKRPPINLGDRNSACLRDTVG